MQTFTGSFKSEKNFTVSIDGGPRARLRTRAAPSSTTTRCGEIRHPEHWRPDAVVLVSTEGTTVGAQTSICCGKCFMRAQPHHGFLSNREAQGFVTIEALWKLGRRSTRSKAPNTCSKVVEASASSTKKFKDGAHPPPKRRVRFEAHRPTVSTERRSGRNAQRTRHVCARPGRCLCFV